MKKDKWDIKVWIAVFFFVLCAGMSLFYLIAGYGAYLDSDMASELVLAKQLVTEKSLVSTQWYYSTEVRLINTQLVFAPLMALFSDNWQLVRTLGCIILLAMLAVSSIFCALRIGAQLRYALIFAAMNISVCSPLYAQNVIIGAYYVPHAVLPMLLVAMYADYLRSPGWKNAAGCVIAAFGMGFSSVRYLVIVIMPLFAAGLWQYTFPEKDEYKKRNGKQHRAAALSMFTAMAGVVGYVICQKVFQGNLLYAFDYYESMGYTNWHTADIFDQIQMVVYGLLYAMGFDGGVPLFGAQGILNALLLLMLFVAALLLKRRAQEQAEASNGQCARFGRLLLVFAAALSLSMFVLLRSVYFDRYWLPVMMLGAPIMASCLSGEKNTVFRRLVVILFAGTVLLTSASCIFYSMRGPQVKDETRFPALEAAKTLGLDKGYATFWNANVLTELSHGTIEMTSVKKAGSVGKEKKLALSPWLETVTELEMDRADEPVFLLIDDWEGEGLETFLQKVGAQEYEINGWINFYLIPSQRQLFEAMN